MTELTIPMDDYDWREAFGCTGDTDGEYNSADVRPANPTSDVSLAPFGRKDVARVFAMREGANDGPNWLCYGRLKDKRYCAFVSNDKVELLQLGMTASERQELGL